VPTSAPLSAPSSPGAKRAKPKRCVRGRQVKLRLRARSGDPLVSAKVFVNGRRAKRLRGRALRRPVRVRMTKRVTRVKLVARTRSGRKVVVTRTYRRCR
jgi:hypothetical protein